MKFYWQNFANWRNLLSKVIINVHEIAIENSAAHWKFLFFSVKNILQAEFFFFSQSPNRSDLARDDLIADDTSSTGNKDDDDDDDDDDGADDKFDNVGDPERLKAFNVSILLAM